MKRLHISITAALLALGVASMSSVSAAKVDEGATLVGVESESPEALSGDRGLGERCTRDCQCASRECKGFKCVARDYNAHPLLPIGKECRFDGDCASCDCAAMKCR
jgi:hypothetical protein